MIFSADATLALAGSTREVFSCAVEKKTLPNIAIFCFRL